MGGEHLSTVNTVAAAQVQFKLPTWPYKFKPVPFPTPVISPIDTDAPTLGEHAALVYKTCWKWVWGGDAALLKQKFWQCLGVMRKDDWAAARKLKVALREAKDSGSHISLLLYVWWEMARALDRGRDGLPPQSCFDASRIASKQVRGFFWRDCGDALTVMPHIWTQASEEAHELFHDFTRYNAFLAPGDVEAAKAIWGFEYAMELKLIHFEHERQYDRIADAIRRRLVKFDIGLWIAADVRDYLKIKDIAAKALK